jgi:hypothetical protein
VISRRTVAIQRSAGAFIRGVCGAVSTTSMPVDANTASKAAVNFASRSRIRCEPVSGVFQAGGQIPGNLGGPVAGRVGSDTEQVDAASVDFDDEHGVQPLQTHGVDVEEVDGQDRAGLDSQERPPRVVAARRRRHAPGAQNPADRGRADTVAQAAQLALDADYPPGPVLHRQADAKSCWPSVWSSRTRPLWLTWAFYAARSYSLRRPPRTDRRLTRTLGEVIDRVIG